MDHVDQVMDRVLVTAVLCMPFYLMWKIGAYFF